MSSSITNGPFLPFDATNTNRKCYTICELLALLDMHKKEEQVDFKRILRDFMTRTPRGELAELTTDDFRYHATWFLDKEEISPFYQTAGKTFWPLHTFIPSSEPGPRPKKWTYIENRNGIIDFVTQIMIIQQEHRKKNDLEKTEQPNRKRPYDEHASYGSEDRQACLSDTSKDAIDDDLTASPAAKKPCTSINSAARIPSPQVSQVTNVVDSCQMLQHIDPATKRLRQHRSDVRKSSAPPCDSSLNVSDANGNLGYFQTPELAPQRSQMGAGTPAGALRPGLVQVYMNAMGSTKDRVQRAASYQDATTQTLPGPDLLTSTLKADLLRQGYLQARERILEAYSKLHLDAVFSHGAEAEQLAMKAKVLLGAAKELTASLDDPDTGDTLDVCSCKRC